MKTVVLDKLNNTKTTTQYNYNDGTASTTIEINPNEFKPKSILLEKIVTLEDKNFECSNELESSYYYLMISIIINITLSLCLFLG